MNQEDPLQYLLQILQDQNNETTSSSCDIEASSDDVTTPEVEILPQKPPSLFDLLQDISRNPDSNDNQEKFRQILCISALSGGTEILNRQSPGILSTIDFSGGNNNEDNNNDEIDMEDTTNEWREEYLKLESREENTFKYDKKDEDRRRQMAKNREYARKCVQKKKDLRKQAEVRSLSFSKRIHLQEQLTMLKERNANFAVELRKMIGDVEGVEQRRVYEQLKEALIRKFDEISADDETVNLNFHRYASAREEFEKAATDLRQKKGVIGTLGSRKIRAKQQMEWRQHLYNISIFEHKLRREAKLSELAEDYVRRTVPQAAPLVQSIPKHLLDALIQNNKTSELEEFFRFVGENSLCGKEENGADSNNCNNVGE